MVSNGCGRESSSFSNIGYTNFFIRPKLRIQFDPHRDVIRQRFNTVNGYFERQYLKVRVRNSGRGVAHGSQAEMEIIIPAGADGMMFPSTESTKILAWGRRGDQSDLSYEKDIRPFSTEYLHIVFSDSRFGTTITTPAGTPIRYTAISSIEGLKNLNTVMVVDSFTNGEFEIELRVTTLDGPYAKQRFRITVDTNWRNLRMSRVTRLQRINARLRTMLQ